MKRRIAFGFMIAMLLIPASVAPSSAHHYLYWAEDPTAQLPSPALKRNYVSVWWWWGWNTLWWTDPAGGPQFIADAQTAIGNWESSFLEGTIQRLPWMETANESLADVKFKLSATPCDSPTAAGCTKVVDWEYRAPPNGNENAAYMKKMEVYVKDSAIWLLPQYRVSAIAHEAGHVYGLHEQYMDIGAVSCNPDVNSVVDGWNELAGMYWPCDTVYGPTGLDVRRVKAFWGGWEAGTPENLKRSEVLPTAAGVGATGYYRWKDFAWAEQVHQMGWYWAPSPDGPWTLYRTETVTEQIGVHFYTENRTVAREVDRSAYGVPANTWHLGCGYTWSVPFQQWSDVRCSNPAIFLN